MPTTCPICERPVETDQAFAPFCSERCRLLDLSRWLDGDYRIGVNDPEGDGLPALDDGEDADVS